MSGTRFSRRGSRFGVGHQSVASGLSGIAVMGTPSFRRKSESSTRAAVAPFVELTFTGYRLFAGMTKENLNPALVGDLAIGLVDGGDLLGGDGDEFLRHAAGDQLVGMIVGHELAVMALQAVIADRGIDTQVHGGTALGGGEVAAL